MTCGPAIRNRLRRGFGGQKLRRLVRHERGQDLLEYGLLMALIVIVAMAGVQGLGDAINSVFWDFIAANS